MAEALNVKTTVTGRLISYKGLFKPDENGKYTAIIVLDTKQDKKVEQIINNAKQNKWGDKKVPGLTIYSTREGDDPEYESTYEHVFIRPKSNNPPQMLVKRNGALHAVSEDEKLFYAGCYVAVSISAYGVEQNKEKQIPNTLSLSLDGMLFLKYGDRLGNSFDAEEAFGNFEDSDDDEAADTFSEDGL